MNIAIKIDSIHIKLNEDCLYSYKSTPFIKISIIVYPTKRIMSFGYEQVFYDEDRQQRQRKGRYNFTLNELPSKYRHRRQSRTQFAQEYFKKRRPKIKLYPGMPLKINQDRQKNNIEMDHQINQIQLELNEQTEAETDHREEQNSLDQLNLEDLEGIDLNIQTPDESNCSLQIVFKNHKPINIIDVDKLPNFRKLDIMQEKIKSNGASPDEILNPTPAEIDHAISAIKSEFKQYKDPFTLVGKLYHEVIRLKRPLNQFLNPFWTHDKDNRLLSLFIQTKSKSATIYQFSCGFNNIRAETIIKRLDCLIKKSMIRYNQQVNIFKVSLSSLIKIGDTRSNDILLGREKESVQIQVLLCKLLISMEVDRKFFMGIAEKVNAYFKQCAPKLRVER